MFQIKAPKMDTSRHRCSNPIKQATLTGHKSSCPEESRPRARFLNFRTKMVSCPRTSNNRFQVVLNTIRQDSKDLGLAQRIHTRRWAQEAKTQGNYLEFQRWTCKGRWGTVTTLNTTVSALQSEAQSQDSISQWATLLPLLLTVDNLSNIKMSR